MVEISKGWGAFPFSEVWWHGIVYEATRLTGVRHEYKLTIPDSVNKAVKLQSEACKIQLFYPLKGSNIYCLRKIVGGLCKMVT